MWETKTVTSLRQPVEPLKNNGYKSNTEGTELIFTGFFFIIFVPLCIRNPAFLGRGLSTLSCGLPGISDCLLDVTRGSTKITHEAHINPILGKLG